MSAERLIHQDVKKRKERKKIQMKKKRAKKNRCQNLDCVETEKQVRMQLKQEKKKETISNSVSR